MSENEPNLQDVENLVLQNFPGDAACLDGTRRVEFLQAKSRQDEVTWEVQDHSYDVRVFGIFGKFYKKLRACRGGMLPLKMSKLILPRHFAGFVTWLEREPEEQELDF